MPALPRWLRLRCGVCRHSAALPDGRLLPRVQWCVGNVLPRWNVHAAARRRPRDGVPCLPTRRVLSDPQHQPDAVRRRHVPARRGCSRGRRLPRLHRRLRVLERLCDTDDALLPRVLLPPWDIVGDCEPVPRRHIRRGRLTRASLPVRPLPAAPPLHARYALPQRDAAVPGGVLLPWERQQRGP